MILGIGVDICDLKRVQKKVKKLDTHFYKYILTENEIKQSKAVKNFILYLTIRFAAKEAFYKAFCLPSQKFLGWKDIEILDYPKSQHKVNLSPKVKKYLKEYLLNNSNYNINFSITYNKNIVICNTIISYYEY